MCLTIRIVCPQDEDLQLAIALSKSLMVARGADDDEAVESNPGGQMAKPSDGMMDEEEQEEHRIAEQLQAFLSDARRILFSANAGDKSLHALIP